MTHREREWIDDRADGLRDAIARLVEDEAETLTRLGRHCAEALAAGRKLLLFGNGGSAAQAQHVAAEFVNRLDTRREALAAIALTTDASVVTSIANDEGFENVFARQFEALGRPGDVAIAFSTSGRSANVRRGLATAHRLGLSTAAFLGSRRGGAAVDGSDASDGRDTPAEIVVRAPTADVARVQELHLFAGHLLCGLVERALDDVRASTSAR